MKKKNRKKEIEIYINVEKVFISIPDVPKTVPNVMSERAIKDRQKERTLKRAKDMLEKDF